MTQMIERFNLQMRSGEDFTQHNNIHVNKTKALERFVVPNSDSQYAFCSHPPTKIVNNSNTWQFMKIHPMLTCILSAKSCPNFNVSADKWRPRLWKGSILSFTKRSNYKLSAWSRDCSPTCSIRAYTRTARLKIQA
eukprot:scaffold342348_cov21-Prasinocladus_malaysianus.AAC.1